MKNLNDYVGSYQAQLQKGDILIAYKKLVSFVMTHDIELTEMLTQNDFELYHFSESIQNQELNFDHKLKEGPLKTKNAIKILALYDFPEQVITEAEMLKNKPN